MSRTLACLALLLALPAFAASPDWQRVLNLPPNAKVRIGLAPKGRVVGRVVSAAPDALTVRTSRGDQILSRGEVRIVRTRTARARGRNVLRNAAIAAGAWAGFLGAVELGSGGFDDEVVGPILGAGLLFYGGVTAGITALVPGYETVYRMP